MSRLTTCVTPLMSSPLAQTSAASRSGGLETLGARAQTKEYIPYYYIIPIYNGSFHFLFQYPNYWIYGPIGWFEASHLLDCTVLGPGPGGLGC